MGLDSIVNINITKGTTGVSTQGFGTLLVLSQHTKNTDLIRFYTSAKALLSDGFMSSDSEYKAALSAFSQDKKPKQIAVGRRTTPTTQVNTVTVTPADSTTFTVTINGTIYSFISGTAATASQIVAGLVAAVNADGPQPVTASGTTSLVLTSDVSGTGFSVVTSSNLTSTSTTANRGVQEDLAAIQAVSNDWYAVAMTSRSSADQLNLASWTEANGKLSGVCSSDANILSLSSTTDIASVLKAKGYVRTFVLYSSDQANFPEMSLFGRCLPDTPGSETWKFKTLSGNTADYLTDSQENSAKSKNCNVYTPIGGVSITSEGVTASGEYIDNTRFIDWVKSNIQTSVYSRLVNAEKLAFTDAGISVVEAEIRKIMSQGVRAGGISADVDYVVSTPKAQDVSSANKTARRLPDVKFSFTLAGAIHAVDPINGTISV